jgi:S1-C subfamily serine protease
VQTAFNIRYLVLLGVAIWALAAPAQAAGPREVVRDVGPKVVKIYGAGGFRGLEPYQTGILISAEGHILTVWSYVLDTEFITITLDSGRKYEQGKSRVDEKTKKKIEQVELLGADPKLELAVLKIDAQDLPHFDLTKSVEAHPGSKVLAFSNLYGVATGNEPVSVQHGIVSIRTPLEARRGVFETTFRGQVYVLDAMTNNPGAAGGVLTNRHGDMLGMLGKELRNSLNNTWLNYAVPNDQMRQSVEDIIKGIKRNVTIDDKGAKPAQALSAGILGISLVPDVLERTPPFIDQIRANSPAAHVGLKSDDLILFVNGRLVQSCKLLVDELERIDRADKVRLTVIRDQELMEVELGTQTTAPKP